PGGRTVTVTVSGGDLTQLTNPDGNNRSFSYDGNHKVTNQQWGPLSTTYAYDATNGTATTVSLDASTSLKVAAANAKPLQTSPARNASEVVGVLTDANSHATSYTLDALGRPTKVVRADGTSETWARDGGGQPAVYTDALGHVTSYTYLY